MAVLSLVATAALQACSDATGVADRPIIEVAFRATIPPRGPSGPDTEATNRRIEGVNGTLVLTTLHLVAAEGSVQGFKDACKIFSAGPDCVAFDAYYPLLVEVPVSGESETVVAASDVEPGEYTEASVTVEDLETPEADGVVSVQLLRRIRARFLDWPDLASLRVAGEFVPAGGGDARPFVVYYAVSGAVTRPIQPALELREDDAPARVTFVVDPESWFVLSDGTVKDLSVFDFRETELLAADHLDLGAGIADLEVVP